MDHVKIIRDRTRKEGFWAAFLEKFDADTNNGAELQALISGVQMSKMMGFQHLTIKLDSAIVVGWITKSACNAWYLWYYWDRL